MAAEVPTAADLKEADRLKKEKQKSLKKYKAARKIKKKNPDAFKMGPNQVCYYDYNDQSTWEFAKHPMIASLEKCGYKDIMFIHTPTGQRQMASYVASKQDQKNLMGAYTILEYDESGTLQLEGGQSVNSDAEQVQSFAAASKGKEFEKWETFLFDGTKWKCVRKFPKNGDVGGYMACSARVPRPLTAEGWITGVEGTHMYWQAVDGEGNPVGEPTWDPQSRVEVGMEVGVTKDKDFFFNAISPHTNHYTDATWDEHQKAVLGKQKGTVVAIEENRNIAKVEIDGATWSVPTECLLTVPEGDTGLLMAEVGQYVFTAQIDLFDTHTHAGRGKQINPILSEFSGIAEAMANMEEEVGWTEMLCEGSENLHPTIVEWQTNNPDWEYE